MPILARLLMLVACVPFLQPTGFCACKLGGVTAAWLRGASAATPAKTSCCAQRHAPDDEVACATERPAPCPAPADDRHLPGCPASVGVDRFKWVEAAAPVAVAQPPVEFADLPRVPVPTPVPARPVTSVTWPSSPPLFLAHCTFVV